jgi:hypothetical protein
VININNLKKNEHDWVLPPVPNIEDVENYPTVTKPPDNFDAIHHSSEEENQLSDGDSTNSTSIQEEINTCTIEVPPGSLLDDEAPPPSPTNICDYPYFDHDDNTYKYSDGLCLDVSTRNRIPRIKRTVSDLNIQIKDSEEEEELEFITSIVTESLVADIGTRGHTISCNRLDKGRDRGKMADTGANCSMTNNLSLLRNVKNLLNLIQVGVAVDAGNGCYVFHLHSNRRPYHHVHRRLYHKHQMLSRPTCHRYNYITSGHS